MTEQKDTPNEAENRSDDEHVAAYCAFQVIAESTPRAELTGEERAVLEACLEYKRSLDRDLWSRSVDVCQSLVRKCVEYAEAELARRAARKGRPFAENLTIGGKVARFTPQELQRAPIMKPAPRAELTAEERAVLDSIETCCKFSLLELPERYPSLKPLATAALALRDARRRTEGEQAVSCDNCRSDALRVAEVSAARAAQQAAESALASARALLERLANGYGDNPEGDELIGDAQAWLSSAPSPAPCSGCAAAQKKWAGAPHGVSELDILARSAAEYAQIIVELDTRIAKVQALVDDSLDARHGPGGCGIYAYSLSEALKR